MATPRVGGKGVETKRVMLRMPVWMVEFLQEEAVRQESDVSKLVRKAIRSAFFSRVDGTTLHRDVSDSHNEASR